MRVLSSTLVHRGRKFSLETLQIESTRAAHATLDVIRHPGAAVILPILETPAGTRIVMIRNQRPAVGKELWELPAGTRDGGEAPEKTAARELEEETGYRAATVEALARFHTTPGMTDELMWAFVARGLTMGRRALEADEDLAVELVDPARALLMIETGELMDGKTILTLLLASRRGII